MGIAIPSIRLPSLHLPPVHPAAELQRAKRAVEVAQTQAKQLIASTHPVELRAPSRPAATPAHPRSLKVVSYNIHLGGTDHAGVEAAVRRLNPDVVCIQEASRAAVAKLGQALGLYSAFIENGNSSKAILSKYPFVPGSVKNENFHDRVKDRFEAAMKSGETEPAIARSALTASLDVGGRPIDVLDTHLSLFNPKGNAEQLRELNAMMRAREAKGRTVVLAGDFNTNLALADGFGTPTNTVAEWNRRYNRDGKSPVGNIADADVRDAAVKLLAGRRGFWDAEERTMKRADGDVDAAAAARQLRLGAVPTRALLEAADGISHPGARKRFDNIIVSRDVRLTHSVIDATTTASDHRPVMTTLAW